MELDFQLTPRTRILIGILGAVLLILLLIQGIPTFYRLFANQSAKTKQAQLLNAKNLVHAAKVLKPIESEIYKATGLVEDEQEQRENQESMTLFDTQPPETVIRARVDALVKRAGIQQNYQLLTKPGTRKQTQKLTLQNRERLVLYLYLKHIEAEERELTEIAEAEAEADTFNELMDAWLADTESEPDTDEKVEETDEDTASGAEHAVEKPEPMDEDEAHSADPIATTGEWKFTALPETIPIAIRAKLAGSIKNMVMQQLRGATDFRQGFFQGQIHRVRTPATPGIFGIGAKPATVEVELQQNSALLDILMHTPDEYAEEPPDIGELQSTLVKYIETIQEQRATLLEQLALAPQTYETQLYTVEMKFKTDLEKLVNLNRLIETDAKWLTIRDLRISADKQASGGEAQRGRNRRGGGDDAANLNIDIFLIAQIF